METPSEEILLAFGKAITIRAFVIDERNYALPAVREEMEKLRTENKNNLQSIDWLVRTINDSNRILWEKDPVLYRLVSEAMIQFQESTQSPSS